MALASVQRILSVEPIEGADKIERVKVLGWDCVVRKGQFKKDDLCVYIEIDTLIPKVLLDDSYDGDELIRLKTVKMRGQISQGLVLPTRVYEAEDGTEYTYLGLGILSFLERFGSASLEEGDDVTEFLGVKKYEKPIPTNMQGIIKGDFPSFIPKTDEIKIQSNPGLLADLKGLPYYITTKLDGTSATYYKFNGEFEVCSRKLRTKEDTKNVYWQMAKKYDLENLIPDGFAIQGEICGPGIQKNPLGLTQPDLFIFSVYNIGRHKYESLLGDKDKDIQDCVAKLAPYLVPIEEMGSSFNYSIKDLLERAKGNYSSGRRKEGIVVRSVDQRISFKVVNNDYLLKDEE